VQPGQHVTDTGRVVDLSEIDMGEHIVNVSNGQTGVLVIESTPPGATLLVNGREVGTARKQMQLDVGRYVVVARLDDYYHVARSEITVEPGRVQRVLMELKPAFGVLDIACEPDGAEVLIDGRSVGQCRFRNERMRSGTFNVEVRKTLHESIRRQVTVQDGRTTSERFQLPAAWGRLTVTSDPTGAEVWFDGRKVGNTPFGRPPVFSRGEAYTGLLDPETVPAKSAAGHR